MNYLKPKNGIIIAVIFCSTIVIDAAEGQAFKKVIDDVKQLPQDIGFYHKSSKKQLDDWIGAAQRVGSFIKAKEPSLYDQYIKDQHKISQFFTTINTIYDQIISPLIGSFGVPYDIKKLEKIIAPLKAARKALDQGAAKFAFWKDKESRQLLDAFKKALKKQISYIIEQADKIIKEKGLVVR